MNIKSRNGSIALFVLVGLLFMSSFLIILFASNINKAKIVKEQGEIINSIYSGKEDTEAYDRKYSLARKNSSTYDNKVVEDNNTIELNYTIMDNLKNYRIYGNSNQIRIIPNEYQEVEYIEGTGTQYIDTGIIPNENTGFKITVNRSDVVSNIAIDGVSETTNNTRFWIGFSTNKAYVTIGGVNLYNNNVRCENNLDYEFSYNFKNSGKFSLNDIDGGNTLTIANTFTRTFGLFCRNNGGILQGVSQKIKKVVFTQENNIVRDMVPCYRKSDGVVGMYDLVERKFYSNSSTGVFLTGPDKEEVVSTELNGLGEYDSTTGKYIIPIKVSRTNQNDSEYEEYNININQQLRKLYNFVDYIDFLEGQVVRNVGVINSYNGEEIVTNWVSSTGSLSAGATVYYGLETPTIESLELPRIWTYDDYTKIEVLADLVSSKVAVEYKKYSEFNIGYKELEYIESTGTQHIDTGFKANHSTRVIMDYCFTTGSSSSNTWIMGARTSCSKDAYDVAGYFNGSRYYFVNYNNGYNQGPNFDLNRHTFDFNKNEFYYDGQKLLEFKFGSFITSNNIYILGSNNTDTPSAGCSAKLYSCKIYDNDVLIRDFIPCYRKSDNEIGLYDIVNDVFYANTGTGTFVAGPIV